VHLLLTPGSADACAHLMKQVGQLYVQHVNRIHGRTGTLWEGRYRSSIAANESYVLACHRYIERNPVRAQLVAQPGDYPWSSYLYNAEGREDSLLTRHPAYLALGRNLEEAQTAYRQLFDELSEAGPENEIRSASRNGRPIGTQPRGRGRPQKNRDRPHISHSEI
jgi:putative transposase